jgi:ribonuclease HII
MDKSYIIGVDEAWRGSWAGPVVAAACALRYDSNYSFSPLLNDSKKLSPKKREVVYSMLTQSIQKGLCYGAIGVISSEVIDRVGIREANRLAMEEALRQLISQIWNSFQAIKIDGCDNYVFSDIASSDIEYIVRGDGFIKEIQAASILAKVSRDNLMEDLAKKYTQYALEKHKWYGTSLHAKLLSQYGPSDIHRKSYAPIKKLILSRE